MRARGRPSDPLAGLDGAPNGVPAAGACAALQVAAPEEWAAADAPEPPQLQGALDALAVRLAAATLGAVGPAAGAAAGDAAPQAYQPRASGSENDALATLRAAMASLSASDGASATADAEAAAAAGTAANGADPTVICAAPPPPTAPAGPQPHPPPLALSRMGSVESLSPRALSPKSCTTDGSSSNAFSGPLVAPGSARSGGSVAAACGGGSGLPSAAVALPPPCLATSSSASSSSAAVAAAAPTDGDLAPVAPPLPLPPALSAKLLRSLTTAAPAVARAAARAGGGASLADPAECLARSLPALAALRVGCCSARCGSLAGLSEAAAPAKPCAGGCGAARFCSRACANAAYGAHRAECVELAGAASAQDAAAAAEAAADEELRAPAHAALRARARRLTAYY
jgi:hypothetical protein